MSTAPSFDKASTLTASVYGANSGSLKKMTESTEMSLPTMTELSASLDRSLPMRTDAIRWFSMLPPMVIPRSLVRAFSVPIEMA